MLVLRRSTSNIITPCTCQNDIIPGAVAGTLGGKESSTGTLTGTEVGTIGGAGSSTCSLTSSTWGAGVPGSLGSFGIWMTYSIGESRM